jgi:hypothetical protein
MNWQTLTNMSWSAVTNDDATSSMSNENEKNDDDDNPVGVKFALMVDDLEAFELLASSFSAGRQFISRSIELVDQNSLEPVDDSTVSRTGIFSLVCFGRQPAESKMQLPSITDFFVVHNDSDSAFQALHGNGQPRLSEYLRYRADLTIVTTPLLTGHSSNIHGTVAIQQSSQRHKLLLQYKALDSGVMCAPRGDGWK